MNCIKYLDSINNTIYTQTKQQLRYVHVDNTDASVPSAYIIFAGTFYYFLLILFYLIQLLIYLSKVIFSHKYAIKLARFMYLHQIIFVFSPFLCWWIILNAHSQIWDSFWQLTFLWKWWKMLFISRQKWFSFSRYLSFCLDFLVVYCPISQEVKANRQWNLVS